MSNSNVTACSKCAVVVSANARVLCHPWCGHRACSKCMIVDPDDKHRYTCPICRKQSHSSEWVDRFEENLQFQKEQTVRHRVTSIMCQRRERFASTPEFNGFLEEREELALALLYGTEEQKQQTNDKLRRFEIENQQEIVENNNNNEKTDRLRVKEIVEIEGTFYEKVKLNYARGLSYSPSTISHLAHPLQREFPELFHTESAVEDRTQLVLPSLLDSTINFDTMQKQHTEKNLLMQAGGFKMEPVQTRLRQEFFSFALICDMVES